MDWAKLLCDIRIRKLMGGRDSTRVPGDRRTEFDRDYDRSIFSNPLKRLQDKAQVFPLEPNDSVRTRLTHSLEVSCVARGLAGSVGQWMAQQGHIVPLGDHRTTEWQIRAIEAIAATCAVIHDLGNPPFGHAGEKAIQEWFRKKDSSFFGDFAVHENREQFANDFLNFEGNAQTLRLVAKLQLLADEHGLNLTCGTFSAACKYTARSSESHEDASDHAKSKPGFFASENDIVQAVREQTGTGDARNPITFLVEAADDAVYSTVDLEDGVKKGVLHWHTFEKWMNKAAADDAGGLIESCVQSAKDQVDGSGLDLRGRAEDEALIQAFRVAAIGNTVAAASEAFQDNYIAIMNGSYLGELTKDGRASGLIKACKKLGRQFVYRSEETLRLELMGRRVIQDLLDIFWEGVHCGDTGKWEFSDRIRALMSRNYRTVFDRAVTRGELPDKYCKLQLVTDYVCGMTDTFACNLHKSLTNG